MRCFSIWLALSCGLVAAGPLAAAESEPTAAETMAVSALARQYIAEMLSDRSGILDLKYINPDASDARGGWAVAYKWSKAADKSRVGPDAQGDWTVDKLTYRLDIDGSYAFSDATNNKDLSTVKAAARLEHGNIGKVHPREDALNEAFTKCALKLPEPGPDEASRRKYDQETDRCVAAGHVEELVPRDAGAYYYSLDFHGGIEGNQNYSDTQTLYGLTAALASQPNERLSMFNVLDWPFRLTRNGFGTDGSSSTGYVAPFPSVKLMIERIDASSNDRRKALTSKTTYSRAEGEVAFNTVMANFGGSLLRFTVSYRYFHEFSAPLEVKRAGMDDFHFVNATLRLPAQVLPFIQSDEYELFVGYTSGKLPFDLQGNKAVEVGFSTNIQVLSDLLKQ